MALVTFSSPEYKDKTVYAVAGSHTETLLKIAKEYQVPIDFECEDGECRYTAPGTSEPSCEAAQPFANAVCGTQASRRASRNADAMRDA